jgi:hypothetical protein
MLHKLGIFSALCTGIVLGWSVCVIVAFALSKKIDAWLDKQPIRATED